MKFPNINTQDCPPAGIGQSTSGGSEGSCPDQRCSDPAFAAANPLICGNQISLVLKPADALECANSGLIQFSTFARSSQGEQQVTAGVVYASSDPSVVAINASTGSATILLAGIATISATWQGLSAFSQVQVIGGGCCDDVCVQTVIVQDNSQSMGQTFGLPATKGAAAHALAVAYADGLQEGKDSDAVVSFNEAALLQQSLVSVIATVEAGLSSFPLTTANQTSLKSGIDLALETLAEAEPCGVLRQQVILLLSDGSNQPPMGDLEVSDLVAETDAFKAGGGIIICVGIRAWGDGYTLLQRLASGGFFINVTPSNYSSAFALLTGLMCYFCAGGGASAGYPGYCLNGQVPAQSPDPDHQLDSETGAVVFTSTKEACVSCSTGQSGPGLPLIPEMTSNTAPSGTASASSEVDAYNAAWKAMQSHPPGWVPVGMSPFPCWLRYSFAVAQTVGSYSIDARWNAGGSPSDWTLQGSNDGSSWTTLDTQSVGYPFLNIPDKFFVAVPASYLHYRLLFTASQIANVGLIIDRFQLYSSTSTETSTCRTSTQTSDVSQADADAKAAASALKQAQDDSGCYGNTSTDPIKWNNGTTTPATPYPSTKTVSGLSGAIAKVTVKLKNVRKQQMSPASILLVSPDGVKVLICSIHGNNTRPLQGVDITFDDAAGSPFPTSSSGPIPAGSYQCVVESPGATTSLPAPAPAQPYNTTLAAFIGGTKNGDWKLYCIHINFYTLWIPPNEISDGWDLTIT